MKSLLLAWAFIQAGHPPVEPAAPPEAEAINRSLLRPVEDDAPPRSESENRGEYLAYDYVVQYAGRVPADAFARAARRDLTFAHLLGADAAAHRGEVVRIEGRLKRLRDIGPTAGLRAEGFKHLYEGWVFSELYQDFAYCVLFTDLPAGWEVAESLDRRVGFDGYFYKIYRYRAGDGLRRAPLLIGRTIQTLPTPVEPPVVSGSALLLVGGAIALSLLALAAIASILWWLDGLTRQRLSEVRTHGRATEPNPFDGRNG